MTWLPLFLILIISVLVAIWHLLWMIQIKLHFLAKRLNEQMDKDNP